MYFPSFEQGKVEAQGTPESLADTQNEFAQMIKLHQHHDQRKLSISSASSDSGPEILLAAAQNVGEDKGAQLEESSRGKFKGSILWSYCRAGANPYVLIGLILLLVFVQILSSGSDYWVSVWYENKNKSSKSHFQSY